MTHPEVLLDIFTLSTSKTRHAVLQWFSFTNEIFHKVIKLLIWFEPRIVISTLISLPKG